MQFEELLKAGYRDTLMKMTSEVDFSYLTDMPMILYCIDMATLLIIKAAFECFFLLSKS